MWRAESLFGQSHYPDHHAAMHGETHHPAEEQNHDVGHHSGFSLWDESAHLCHACHAQLLPHEYAAGCCEDKDACCWRALSERCCW